MKNFNINSEYHSLKSVILGTAREFIQGEKINKGMKKYYGTKNGPLRKKLILEYNALEKILRDNKVKVYKPKPSKIAPQQLAPRDIGFVIGNTFIISNLKKESRKREIDSIKHILNKFKGRIIKSPKDVILEGGNIIIDKDKIFIGIGIRTNKKAVSFLQKKFGQKYSIHPVFTNDRPETIHLDAAFNIISQNYALIWPPAFKKFPSAFHQYKLIKVSKKEKNRGACNVLSINSKILIIKGKLRGLKTKLEQRGFKIFVVKWDETKKTGTVGPRCAVLPLVRYQHVNSRK